MPDTQDFLDIIIQFYIESGDRFNGIPLDTLLDVTSSTWDDALPKITDLVIDENVTLCFASVSVNPHIKRVPDLPVDRQIEILKQGGPGFVCAYPTSRMVRERIDVSTFNDRLFTKELLLCAPQLTPVFFDIAVLERYYDDPRYHFSFSGFGGSLSITDKHYLSDQTIERDKVGLQTFGLGFDENENRVVVVYLRYLANLNREHQKYWSTYIVPGECKVVEEYYKSTMLGEFPHYVSIYSAFVAKLHVINQICSLIGRPKLFRNTFKNQSPREFGFFFRPTLYNYNRFVLILDKMLSENINTEFFTGDVDLEEEIRRVDGRIEVRRRNTISMFDEWLLAYITNPEESALETIIGPMRDVRRQRQKPAHKIQENEYDPKCFGLQRELMGKCYECVRFLRLLFSNHPAASAVEVPGWLYEGRIKNP